MEQEETQVSSRYPPSYWIVPIETPDLGNRVGGFALGEGKVGAGGTAIARLRFVSIPRRGVFLLPQNKNKSMWEGRVTKKILIADDEPNIVISLEFLLKREGYEVVVAYNGVEALAKVRAERPDLAILDVMMPQRNGFEVCQDLRQDPEFKDLRIMMLTAKGRDTEVSKGLALGADVYMTKPFATRELMAKVNALIERA
jgi:CheY-like chemotaxis protein